MADEGGGGCVAAIAAGSIIFSANAVTFHKLSQATTTATMKTQTTATTCGNVGKRQPAKRIIENCQQYEQKVWAARGC